LTVVLFWLDAAAVPAGLQLQLAGWLAGSLLMLLAGWLNACRS
jgi:hypothetical protein